MAVSRAVVIADVGKVEVRTFPLPEIGPDEALLQVEMAGVCGSDPKLLHGQWNRQYLPLVPGHETLGRLAQVGAAVTARTGRRAGDRVVVETLIPCGGCRWCLNGNYRYCLRKRGYGTQVSVTVPPHLWGSYAEYMYLAPGTILHPIAESVPAKAGVLVNAVIANGVQWLETGGMRYGDAVVIQGSGPQGLAGLVAAREYGARVVVVTGLTRDRRRLDLALELGADRAVNVETEDLVQVVRDVTGGDMADVVLDVTGSPRALATSVHLVRQMGTVVCAGLTGKGTVTSLEMDVVVERHIRLQGVFSKTTQAVKAAVRLVESGKYPLERMVTHVYPLEQAEQALKVTGGEVPGEEPIKVVVRPQQGK